MAGDQPRRTNNFDFLRLIGAVLVLYGHSYALTGHPAPGLAGEGTHVLGVKIFFCISGYLIAQSWTRDPNIRRFLLRRCLRIFPALVVTILASALVLGPVLTSYPLSKYYFNYVTVHYLKNAFLYIGYLLPGVFDGNPNHAVNGSLWSLPAEFFMYLMTPLLLALRGAPQKYAFGLIAVLLFAGNLLIALPSPTTPQYIFYAADLRQWLLVIPYFVIGAAFAVYSLENLANIYVAFVAMLVLAVLPRHSEAIEMLVLPYAVIAFGLGYAPALRRVTNGNDLSYGIFLFAFPVQQTVIALLGPNIAVLAVWLIALTVSAGLAYLSWNFIESPMLKWKPGRTALAAATEPGPAFR